MSDLKSIDDQTAQFLTDWSQRVSRRGLLARVANLALKIAGISIVPLLPVDRAFAQGGGCDWRTCNMHGYFCSNCCGGSGSFSTCPNCTSRQGSWVGCCEVPGSCPKRCRLFRYYDCCAPAGTGTSCRGSQCGSLPWPAYCTSGEFRCTIVVDGGTCNSC